MKKHIFTTLVLLLALVAMHVNAQVISQPFSVQILANDTTYAAGSKIKVPLGTQSVSVRIISNVSGSEFIAKKYAISIPMQLGSSKEIASFPIPRDKGNNFEVPAPTSNNLATYTFTLEGITEVRGEKSRSVNTALRYRCFTVQYYRP